MRSRGTATKGCPIGRKLGNSWLVKMGITHLLIDGDILGLFHPLIRSPLILTFLGHPSRVVGGRRTHHHLVGIHVT